MYIWPQNSQVIIKRQSDVSELTGLSNITVTLSIDMSILVSIESKKEQYVALSLSRFALHEVDPIYEQ